ncbi:MAG: hypothetical protein ACI8PZ_001417 [Myxococcota bacterium]|jgi:hypothetical protein
MSTGPAPCRHRPMLTAWLGRRTCAAAAIASAADPRGVGQDAAGDGVERRGRIVADCGAPIALRARSATVRVGPVTRLDRRGIGARGADSGLASAAASTGLMRGLSARPARRPTGRARPRRRADRLSAIAVAPPTAQAMPRSRSAAATRSVSVKDCIGTSMPYAFAGRSPSAGAGPRCGPGRGGPYPQRPSSAQFAISPLAL